MLLVSFPEISLSVIFIIMSSGFFIAAFLLLPPMSPTPWNGNRGRTVAFFSCIAAGIVSTILASNYVGDTAASATSTDTKNDLDYHHAVICVETKADEESISLVWQPNRPLSTDPKGVLPERPVVLTRWGFQYCGRLGPFEANTVTTVTVKNAAHYEWVASRFEFRYPVEGEPNVSALGRSKLVYASPDDGYYRFRIITADLTEDIPTTSINQPAVHIKYPP